MCYKGNRAYSRACELQVTISSLHTIPKRENDQFSIVSNYLGIEPFFEHTLGILCTIQISFDGPTESPL